MNLRISENSWEILLHNGECKYFLFSYSYTLLDKIDGLLKHCDNPHLQNSKRVKSLIFNESRSGV